MKLRRFCVFAALVAQSAYADLIEPPLVKIAGGQYLMGSEHGMDNEKPVHTVAIKPFYVGKYEVTVKEFRQFMNATNFERTSSGGDLCWSWDSKEYMKPIKGNWDSEFNAPSDFHPVMCISGDQAQAYVDWLSESAGKPYRLLSESEWEYVARAENAGKYHFGDSSEALCQYGNVFDKDGKAAIARDYQLNNDFKHANCHDNAEYTSIVGLYQPNGFGLYDTIGNVAELVKDCEHTSYENAPTDGSAWLTNCSLLRGEHKMLVSRGGAYGLMSSPYKLRSAYRAHFGAGNGEGSSIGEGFRVAMDYIAGEPHVIPASTRSFTQELTKAQESERARRQSSALTQAD